MIIKGFAAQVVDGKLELFAHKRIANNYEVCMRVHQVENCGWLIQKGSWFGDNDKYAIGTRFEAKDWIGFVDENDMAERVNLEWKELVDWSKENHRSSVASVEARFPSF